VLTGSQLDAAVRNLVSLSRPLHNRVYGRAIRFRHKDDLLGRGRRITDQRFNVAGGARILYLGHDYYIALQETQALGGVVLSAWVIFPVWVHLNAVVHLRDPKVQRLLQTDIVELTANFRALPSPTPTQQLGEACRRHGRIDGLLFPSAINRKWTNLAVIEQGLYNLTSSIGVDDPDNGLSDKLPP